MRYHSQGTISGLCSYNFSKEENCLSVICQIDGLLRTDVFHSVGPFRDLTLALLPQENSIFGIVTETYDLLRSSELGESKWIRGAVTLPVQHCLIVRRGKTMRDIKTVLSHEQVCSFFFFFFWSSLNLTPSGRCVAQRPLAGLGTVSTIPCYVPARGTAS